MKPDDVDYTSLPDYMVQGIKAHIEHGRRVGDFLTALLENDLQHAILRADPTNAALLKEWIRFLINEAPSPCHGSRKKVELWRGRGGLMGPCTGVVKDDYDDDDRCHYCNIKWKDHTP